jgi:hypothetical protein
MSRADQYRRYRSDPANVEKDRLRAEAARRARGVAPRLPSDIANHANDPRHGTANGYQNLGCRCPECKAAFAAFKRAYSARRKERLSSHAETGENLG